jgi:hypothetical protein
MKGSTRTLFGFAGGSPLRAAGRSLPAIQPMISPGADAGRAGSLRVNQNATARLVGPRLVDRRHDHVAELRDASWMPVIVVSRSAA